MSDEKPAEAAAPSGHKESKLPLILLLVSFLTSTVAMVVLIKTRVLYKRPVITEESERKRLEALAKAKAKIDLEPGLVAFDPVTINIAPVQGRPHYATIGFSLQIRDNTRQSDVEAVRALIMDKFLGLVGRKEPYELNNVQGRFVLRTELIDAANKVIFENAGKIKPDTAPQAAAPAAGEGGEGGGEHAAAPAKAGGEGGEGGGGEGAAKKPAKPEAPKPPIKDLVTNVYFSQFIIQ
jgi:flagellar basal body-associated protein FliL